MSQAGTSGSTPDTYRPRDTSMRRINDDARRTSGGTPDTYRLRGQAGATYDPRIRCWDRGVPISILICSQLTMRWFFCLMGIDVFETDLPQIVPLQSDSEAASHPEEAIARAKALHEG